jgi:hypothetical protein
MRYTNTEHKALSKGLTEPNISRGKIPQCQILQRFPHHEGSFHSVAHTMESGSAVLLISWSQNQQFCPHHGVQFRGAAHREESLFCVDHTVESDSSVAPHHGPTFGCLIHNIDLDFGGNVTHTIESDSAVLTTPWSQIFQCWLHSGGRLSNIDNESGSAVFATAWS